MTRPTVTDVTRFDCRTCGACCIGNLDDGSGFACVTSADRSAMSPRVRRKLTVLNIGSDEHYATPTTYTEEFGASCSFLRGTPGRRVSCGIYKSRPEVCRKYRPGSGGCISERLDLGLP